MSDCLLKMIDKEIDEKFISMVTGLLLRPRLVKTKSKECKIVFTPVHGTGAMPVAESLKRLGIDVIFVPEQKEPDGFSQRYHIPIPKQHRQ